MWLFPSRLYDKIDGPGLYVIIMSDYGVEDLWRPTDFPGIIPEDHTLFVVDVCPLGRWYFTRRLEGAELCRRLTAKS